MASSGIAQPTTLSLRPLVAGMRTDSGTLLQPQGSFRDLRGYDVRSRGPRRADGRRLFIPDAVPMWEDDEVITDIVSHWGTDDKQFNSAITNRALYKIEFASPTGYYSPVWFQREYTVASYVSGTGVLTFDTNSPTTDLVRAGDYVVLASALTTRRAISVVSGMTATIPTGLTIANGAKFYVLRMFQCNTPYYVDYAFYARSTTAQMVIVDGSVGGIYTYNGGYLIPMPLHFPGTPDTAAYTAARTVMYFGGRLYFGCVTLAGATYRQRIIWTEVLDLTEVPADAYQDLDETPGQILKLVGLGSLAFAYFTDAAYYGRPTNLDGLPYAFTKLDTGGVGLAGQRAACPFFDGQIFVSSDEIYYVTASEGLSPIGTPVIADSLKPALAAGSLNRTMVRVDVPRQRVLFGFALSGGSEIDTIFAYNYVTKAWSYVKQGAVTAFNVVNFADEVEYDDIDVNATYADYADVLYTAFGGNFAERQLTYVDNSGYIYVMADNSTHDELYDGSIVPIVTQIETGDFDLDEPDTDKTIMELRAKVTSGELDRTAAVVFQVWGSADRGDSWKSCGTLAIPTTKSEGACGFRLTGSHFRFRFRSESVVEPYELTEITLRAVVRNLEGNRGTTTSNP
jgi:hypothetical protein